MTTANKARLAYVGRQPGADRDSDSWYTPALYIETARKVMGKIDLDPFSSQTANQTIKATTWYCEERSAFAIPWKKGSNVWMNPPYGAQLISKAIAAFLENWKENRLEQAIILTNNATDTRWFADLRQHCAAVCFTDHRIAFESPDGKRVSGNTRGQSFFYFGDEQGANRFVTAFEKFGWCISKTTGWAG